MTLLVPIDAIVEIARAMQDGQPVGNPRQLAISEFIARIEALSACRTCGGSGEMWSNPQGMGPFRDPQLDEPHPCPTCGGDGAVAAAAGPENEAEAA
jgi:DnaJ-class molecular chaperone